MRLHIRSTVLTLAAAIVALAGTVGLSGTQRDRHHHAAGGH